MKYMLSIESNILKFLSVMVFGAKMFLCTSKRIQFFKKAESVVPFSVYRFFVAHTVLT